MKFAIKNLGPIKNAEVEFGNLTILCGPNNMGKSYLTYSIYSFLETVAANITFDIKSETILELVSTGSCTVDFNDLWYSFPKKLEDVLQKYSRCIPRFLAIQKSPEEKAKIQFAVSDYDTWKESFLKSSFDNQNEPIPVGKDIAILVSKERGSSSIKCSLESKTNDFPKEDKISVAFTKKISYCVMEKMLPLIFGLTGERSGISIFSDFLNKIAREKNNNEKYKENEEDSSKHKINVELEYALPLRDEVNFLLNLKHYKRKNSVLNGRDQILNKFAALAGGQYSCGEEDSTIYFLDDVTKERYTITETSSSIKSLAELFFYIKHIASPGQLLMIDEPELNLHPASQRKIARLLAMIVNAGIHVFVTTHSDYIIREFNTMIMLNQRKDRIKRIQKKYKYLDDELLQPDHVRCYVVSNCTVKKMNVSSALGIEVTSFDDTINQVNQIQQSILFGVE